MTTPFPGMDPYLESPAYWRDFHQSFVTYWRDWLLDHLPDHYAVSIDERVTRIADVGGRTDMLPDVTISQLHPLPSEVPSGAAVALDREPVTMRVTLLDDETESFLRIHHLEDNSPITVLELLSPTNKDGAGRDAYLVKRQEILRDPIRLVEVDLLLGGRRLPMAGPLSPGDSYGIVSRGDQRPNSEVYAHAWSLPEPLPRIRVPLTPPDSDVVFDLPAVFCHTYDHARYARRLRHDRPPAVPLPVDRAAWVSRWLAAQKLQA